MVQAVHALYFIFRMNNPDCLAQSDSWNDNEASALQHVAHVTLNFSAGSKVLFVVVCFPQSEDLCATVCNRRMEAQREPR